MRGLLFALTLWVFLADGSKTGRFVPVQDHPEMSDRQNVKTLVDGNYVRVIEWKSKGGLSSGTWDELACFTVKEFRYLTNVDPRDKKP